jgi:hypothetical protein
MASQYPPSEAVHAAPRLRGTLETLHAVAPLKGGVCRLTGILAFAGGPKVIIAAAWARSSERAQGQLQFAGGLKVSVEGRVRGASRASSLPVLPLYYATPSREPARVSGSLRLRYDNVGPTLTSGRAAGQPFINSLLKAGLQGRAEAAVRVSGRLGVRQQVVGYVRASGQSRGVLTQRPPLSGVTRDLAVVHCAPLAFLPPNFVTIQGGVLRASARLTTTVRTYAAASPIRETAAARAVLGQRPPLLATSLSGGRAYGIIGTAPPTVKNLDGTSRTTARVMGALPKTFYAAAPSQDGGRIIGGLISRVNLLGVTRLHPHGQAVLAFTGGTLRQILGQIVSAGRLSGDLHTLYPAQPSRAVGLSVGVLTTRVFLAGMSREQAAATGAFPNPYAQASSLGSGGRAVGIFNSALPLAGGQSRGPGRVAAELTMHGLTPELIFLAQCRHYVFAATGRVFVIRARVRQYVFTA